MGQLAHVDPRLVIVGLVLGCCVVAIAAAALLNAFFAMRHAFGVLGVLGACVVLDLACMGGAVWTVRVVLHWMAR